MNDESGAEGCPLFEVRNGGPIIGLGILVIFFGIIPLLIKGMQFPAPLALVFIGFGVFLVWVGLTK